MDGGGLVVPPVGIGKIYSATSSMNFHCLFPPGPEYFRRRDWTMTSKADWDFSKLPKTGVYFLIFILADTLLSYAPWGLTAKLWVFLFGVLLPFFLAAASTAEAKKKEPAVPAAELFSLSSPLPWILVLGLGLAARLAPLVMPGNWPTWDDARFAYYPMELFNRWRWTFFFSPTQHPPLFHWGMALFYRLIPPSLKALWLYPALCAMGALALLAWAARRLFSRSFAFLLAFLMAFNFWPLYAGKFCMYMAGLVFWECLTLAAFAIWVKPLAGGRKEAGLFLLGLCVAGGFWVSISWPVAALAASIAVIVFARQEKKRGMGRLAFFFGPVALSALGFAWVSLHFRNGVHVHQLWAFAGQLDPLRQLVDSASNLTVLFWGCDLQNAYGPVSGGVLNPLEGACFFLGMLEVWRFRNKAWALMLAAAFALLIAPGMVTRNFDLFRNTQLLPVLLLATALGAGRALLSIPPRSRAWALALALPLTLFLDLRQVWLTYRPEATGANQPSSCAFAMAYPLLKEAAQKQGPGCLLFELRPHESDQSLAVATYAFNATVNPHISEDQVFWVAVITDADYRPFLEHRFKDGRWWNLYDEKNLDRQGINLALGIIPVGNDRMDFVEKWVRADKALRDIVWETANIPEDGNCSAIFPELSRAYPLVQGDPFLESIYWEWAFNFHGWENAFGDRDTAVHGPALLQAIREELERGYPTAFFYNELGAFLDRQGDVSGARKAFEKAVRCPLNLTRAADNLRALDALKNPAPSRTSPAN
jgi:hypothetical protein